VRTLQVRRGFNVKKALSAKEKEIASGNEKKSVATLKACKREKKETDVREGRERSNGFELPEEKR